MHVFLEGPVRTELVEGSPGSPWYGGPAEAHLGYSAADLVAEVNRRRRDDWVLVLRPASG